MITPGGNVEYEQIKNKLEELSNQKVISEYIRCTIIDMSNKVLEHIAAKYDSVKEGVKSVMGGKILEYEAKTIKKEGIEQGIKGTVSFKPGSIHEIPIKNPPVLHLSSYRTGGSHLFRKHNLSAHRKSQSLLNLRRKRVHV